MDFKELSERLCLEEDEYKALVELFIETSLSDLNIFRSAVQTRNTGQAAKAVHSVKGAANNLGLTELYDTVRKIEIDLKNNQSRSRPRS